MPSKKLVSFAGASTSECEPLVVGNRRAGLRLKLPAVLRPLKAQAEAREGLVRLAEHRVVARRCPREASSPRSRARRPCTASAAATAAARRQSALETCRIASRLERLLRDEPRRLMVAVAVALVALEPRDEHEAADRVRMIADDVAQDVFASPLVERLVEPLREAIVDRRS